MSEDTRNQGLVGMSDGIPMFRDKSSRSVIPCLLRTANMGDHLSMKFRYTHLTGLVPAHFWIISENGKHFVRVERKPSDILALLYVVTDDLLIWEDGEEVEDHSKREEDPARRFQLRATLLYWCGDYPGQGEASGFSHAAGGSKACHWCEIKGQKSKAIERQKYTGYYRCAHWPILLEVSYKNPTSFVCLPNFYNACRYFLEYPVYLLIYKYPTIFLTSVPPHPDGCTLMIPCVVPVEGRDRLLRGPTLKHAQRPSNPSQYRTTSGTNKATFACRPASTAGALCPC